MEKQLQHYCQYNREGATMSKFLFMLKYYLLSIMEIKWIHALWGILLAPLVGISEFIILVFLIVIIDTVSGVMKSVKVDGEKFISKRLREGLIVKLLSYFLTILAIQAIQVWAIGYDLKLTNAVCTLITLVEFKSITENFEAVTGNTVFGKIYKLFSKKIDKKEDKE